MSETEAMLWAFRHVFHNDCMNAAMHCSQVRFSPITFRLAEALTSRYNAYGGDGLPGDAMGLVRVVMGDRGLYEEDPGRA